MTSAPAVLSTAEQYQASGAELGADHPIAPRPPWQNPYAERPIGSIRRERLDHAVVMGAAHLRGVLNAYVAYCSQARTHRSLAKVT